MRSRFLRKNSHAIAMARQASAGFEELERRFGWNFDPGLEARLIRLDPPRTVHFDWQHVVFVGGVFNVHMEIFIRTLAMKSKLLAYLRLPWMFPRIHKVRAYDAASVAVNKEKFGCTASEGLTILHLYQASPNATGRGVNAFFWGGRGLNLFLFSRKQETYISPLALSYAQLALEESHSGLSVLIMQMLQHIPEAERKPYVCIVLLQRIVERMSFAHRFHCATTELKRMVPQYLELFQSLYGTECCTHKSTGFAYDRLQ
jgi:hypothetical protein